MDQQQFDASVNAIIRHKAAEGEARAAIADARVPPPTVEYLRCWHCAGIGWFASQDGHADKIDCWTCGGSGKAKYEVRR